LFFGSSLCWSILLSVLSFAHKKLQIHICSLILLKHTSNDCICWFSALKHIFKGHADLWSGLEDFDLVFLELFCVMCMLESLEFEVSTSVVRVKINIFI
jgi:hypothetical protein